MMARDPKQNTEQSSIDAILKSLTSRPNVQSTLILSRKDGSIIRATGFTETKSMSGVAGRGYDWSQPSDTSNNILRLAPESQIVKDNESLQREPLSPEQELAGQIFAFVNASAKLVSGISPIRSSAAVSNAKTPSDKVVESKEQEAGQLNLTDEDDVQLLRVRTRRQEIIVFPDPNYLCCVIQNLVKSATRQEVI